jgi:KilA-N domain
MTYTNDDFAVLKNGIDSRMNIIRHNDTEFYNITKGIEMLSRTNEYTPRLTLSQLFDEEDIKQMIAACKEITKLETVLFEVKSGTDQQFMGVYVHHVLYNYFLWFLNTDYAVKMCKVADDSFQKIQEEERLINQMADQLNAKIKQLEMANQ